ncbi:hypothetical protein DPMN_120413 [Dreissena polymorpha]|uniref:C-type lectin domain-containing protein n=1 Tax=Dreissena polymorpha TaxID=45954 RepID=A0A9D4JNI4_DREPO|nr:hypothetical protein DPMN_120413 [Dreissena polymorpha]
MTAAKTYRVLCEKPISHSTTTIPTVSSALNSVTDQTTPGTTIKTSIEQTQSTTTVVVTSTTTNTERHSNESRWIRDNLNEYFVIYKNLTLSDARASCKMSNATLVAFMDVYQYFKLSGRLQLDTAGYWIDGTTITYSICP